MYIMLYWDDDNISTTTLCECEPVVCCCGGLQPHTAMSIAFSMLSRGGTFHQTICANIDNGVGQHDGGETVTMETEVFTART